MSKRVTILDAFTDPNLFGKQFSGASWKPWKAFLAALFGLPLRGASLSTYRTHTGRTERPAGPSSEAFAIVGRRGGKSRIMAAIGVYLACFSRLERHLAPGEVGTVMLIAADRKQARTLFRYAEGLIDGSDLLRQMVVARTKESITLNNRVLIEVHTASYRTTRGYTLLGVLLDEVAFWRSDETSAEPDAEVLNALRPGMATIPGAMLVAGSTPYARSGELYRAYDKHWGRDDSSVLVWQGDTRSMNATVPEDFIVDQYERDPLAAAAEYGAEFRKDVESLVSPEVVKSSTVVGRFELPPVDGVRYVAFTDPSGGSSDSFTLAVAHEENGLAVLDCVREVRPPFSPDSVVKEFCDLLRLYNVTEVTGDRYGGEWPRERFETHGITYRTSKKTKSDLYLAVLPKLNSGQVELLDHARLAAQFIGLERRTARSGRDTIDHGPRSHDDVCNAVAGALVNVQEPKREMLVGRFYPGSSGGVEIVWD